MIRALGFDEDDNGDEVQYTGDDNVWTNGEATQETEIGLEVPTNAQPIVVGERRREETSDGDGVVD